MEMQHSLQIYQTTCNCIRFELIKLWDYETTHYWLVLVGIKQNTKKSTTLHVFIWDISFGLIHLLFLRIHKNMYKKFIILAMKEKELANVIESNGRSIQWHGKTALQCEKFKIHSKFDEFNFFSRSIETIQNCLPTWWDFCWV